MRFLKTSVVVTSLFAAVACSDSSGTNDGGGDAGSNPTPDTGTTPDTGSKDDAAALKDIVDTASGAGNFTTLVTAVKAAGLETTLRGTGPFTVFAPTDDAFKKVPAFLITELTSAPYKTELGLILKYHVLSGAVKAADVSGKTQQVASVEGGKLTVDGTNGKVVVNGANVIKADVLASNGVIHAIDNVLLPTIVDTATGYDDGTNKFTQLVAAVASAGLVDTLSKPGTLTVFAPTDAAFDALKQQLGAQTYNAIVSDKAKLTKILTYHVVGQTVFAKDVTSGAVPTLANQSINVTVSNGKVTIGDSTATKANVILTDLPNSNGVIHVIDKVLIPANL